LVSSQRGGEREPYLLIRRSCERLLTDRRRTNIDRLLSRVVQHWWL